jgi:uncharacterized protein YndB with AHSA1/START domain
MVGSIALVVVVLLIVSVAGVVALAATKPDTFRVERSTVIKAPPETVFPLISDLRKQLSWSPFDKDAEAKRTFSENACGKGASYAWDGNGQVGKGRVEIVDVAAPSKVAMKLEMERPIAANNDVEFTLDGDGDSTRVTWAMVGALPFLGKVMSLFMDCDSMCGREFEKGLAGLKSMAEANA